MELGSRGSFCISGRMIAIPINRSPFQLTARHGRTAAWQSRTRKGKAGNGRESVPWPIARNDSTATQDDENISINLIFYLLAFRSSGLRAFPAGGSFWPLKVPVRRQISGMLRDLLALIRWLNRLKNYALFRTQTLCRIEQNHVSRQSNSSAGR